MSRRTFLAALLTIAACIGPQTPADASGSGFEPLTSASGWLGARLSGASLRGKVVVVDVFTFECINCVHVTPNLKALYRRYSRADLAIVAVHTPEVPSYQRRLSYLASQKRAAALPWPIAIDNDAKIWNAYGVSAWPTQLVFDRRGVLRYTIVGEGQDEALDSAVRRLL